MRDVPLDQKNNFPLGALESLKVIYFKRDYLR